MKQRSSPDSQPEQTVQSQSGLHKIAISATASVTLVLGGLWAANNQSHDNEARVKNDDGHHERNIRGNLTIEEVRDFVRNRIKLVPYGEAMRYGIQCGDGRNEKGLTTFGGEGSLLEVVLEEVEDQLDRELTDEEVRLLLNDYPDIVVIHTDTDGLTHVTDEIKKHSFLARYFTHVQLQEIIDQGLRTDHVRNLIGSEIDGEKIRDALCDIARKIQCQGCGHLRTLLSESHRKEGEENVQTHIADRVLKEVVCLYLQGSPNHQVVLYIGKHQEGGVLSLETEKVPDNDQAMVAALKPEGSRNAFTVHPQIAPLRIEKIAEFVSQEFPELNYKLVAQRALVRYQEECRRTALSLAEGFPVYKVTVKSDEDFTVESLGKIE